MLSPGSPAALNASLQPVGVFTAAVEPVIRSRRRSGPAAAPSPVPHSPPHVQSVTAAAAVPQPSARVAPAVAPPQPSEQARSHAPPPFPDSSSVTERAAASIPPAGAAASSTPVPGLARPRIPSHSVARSITRDTRRLTRRVDKSAGRRSHQLCLRLSNLRVLVRPLEILSVLLLATN